ISFLRHVIRLLNIDEMVAHQIRAEQMGGNRAERFDIVITRALGALNKCVQLALPLVNREKGIIIAMRGRMGEDEVPSLRRLINKHPVSRQSEQLDYDLTVRRFSLPFLNDQRTIVVVHFPGR
ncbi:MAG: RsmG family class I SAM-dependent methyltransferase, partial [Thermodesulfobacteriota bacterium]|nr:RsmG family class I SAM-dependent methyltransferase [Thermodesulfobacteriota bacterium]